MLLRKGGCIVLELKNLNVAYGDMKVLHDINVKVEEGSTVTIVGANGAGKTTTLKTISSLLKPVSGEIWFEGKRIDHLKPAEVVKLGIIHVPEGRKLFPFMTVRENLEMGSLLEEPRKNRAKNIKMVYNMFPRLEERQKQYAGTLSGGERQMLAIARGLMSMPKLLMLDEPSLGLAPILVTRVIEIIKEINEKGITVLLVEQNVKQSLQLADKGYVLENGNIILEGKGGDLLNDNRVKTAYLGL